MTASALDLLECLNVLLEYTVFYDVCLGVTMGTTELRNE